MMCIKVFDMMVRGAEFATPNCAFGNTDFFLCFKLHFNVYTVTVAPVLPLLPRSSQPFALPQAIPTPFSCPQDYFKLAIFKK